MIAYEELEKAINRWKARLAAARVAAEQAAAAAAAPAATAETRKRRSSLDWSMEEAIRNTPGTTDPGGYEATEGDSAVPEVEASTEPTNELEVGDIEEDHHR